MTVNLISRTQLVAVSIPLGVILISILIALSPLMLKHPEIAMGVTYDLVLTGPLLYFLYIRKKKIPNFTVFPVIILGIAIAGALIPEPHQNHLALVKQYLLPIVELTILAVFSYRTYTVLKKFKLDQHREADFYSALKTTANDIMGSNRFTNFLISEIAMFYYALFAWRKKKAIQNQFTVYKDNGQLNTLSGILMIVVIETIALHFLISLWNLVVAWVITLSSIYTFILILGHLRALIKRPIVVGQNELIIRNGLYSDITVPLNTLKSIQLNSGKGAGLDIKSGFSGLSNTPADYNVVLRFKEKLSVQKIYGFKQSCELLYLQVDDKNNFVSLVREQLENRLV